MKFTYAAALLATIATVVSAPSYAGPILATDTFALRVYDVDDVMSAFITNSSHSQQLMFTANFNQDFGYVDISSYVTPGANDILLQLFNGPAGWTYGYDFTTNGTSFDAGHCGVFNTIGCNNSDLSKGLVWSHDINFNVESATNPIPEPNAGALVASGLLAMIALALMRKKAFILSRSKMRFAVAKRPRA
jgi:hypothetical protein